MWLYNPSNCKNQTNLKLGSMCAAPNSQVMCKRNINKYMQLQSLGKHSLACGCLFQDDILLNNFFVHVQQCSSLGLLRWHLHADHHCPSFHSQNCVLPPSCPSRNTDLYTVHPAWLQQNKELHFAHH